MLPFVSPCSPYHLILPIPFHFIHFLVSRFASLDGLNSPPHTSTSRGAVASRVLVCLYQREVFVGQIGIDARRCETQMFLHARSVIARVDELKACVVLGICIKGELTDICALTLMTKTTRRVSEE